MDTRNGKAALRAEHPEADILMVTSQLGPQIVERLKLGAVGYVEKPFGSTASSSWKSSLPTVPPGRSRCAWMIWGDDMAVSGNPGGIRD